MSLPDLLRRSALPLAIGVGLGILVTASLQSPAQVPPEFKKESPPFRGLDANLYMQSSAEYRACCLQAYSLARTRLASLVAVGKADPAKPLAVVLDLDETVFDNGTFQTSMLRSGLAYDQKLWDVYEEKYTDEVRLIPGAKEFLAEAKSLGVAPVYISNRNDIFREKAKALLQRVELAVPDEQLLLATTTSDKTARRAKVRESFDVVLYVGDNLRDFDERFRYDAKAGPDARVAEVAATREKFGIEWIILPNPAYGEWQKALGQGEKDLDRMPPTKMNVP